MMRVPRAALVGSLASLAPRSSLYLALRMMTSAASPAAPMPAADFGGWDPVGRSKLVPLVSRPDELYVVSSSSRGIGLEFATQLLQRTQGRVVGLARDPSGSAGMASLVQSHPDRFLPVQCDLTCQASVDAAGAEVARLASSGGGRGAVDLLMNVAGVLGDGSRGTGPERSLGAINRAWLQGTLEVNLVGHVMMTQALLPLLKKRRSKGDDTDDPHFNKVVNLSARVGSIGDNGLGGWYSYRMSKSALNQFTKTAALELKRHGCVALSLHPGTTDTDLSVPFQKNVAEHKLFPAWFACGSMLDVVWAATDKESGGFYAYDGSEIPW